MLKIWLVFRRVADTFVVKGLLDLGVVEEKIMLRWPDSISRWLRVRRDERATEAEVSCLRDWVRREVNGLLDREEERSWIQMVVRFVSSLPAGLCWPCLLLNALTMVTFMRFQLCRLLM